MNQQLIKSLKKQKIIISIFYEVFTLIKDTIPAIITVTTRARNIAKETSNINSLAQMKASVHRAMNDRKRAVSLNLLILNACQKNLP